ncbi:hypothetical protein V6N13_091686 [Hibiscus sabdariffa]|uniref:MATH domain-containing protein n=1 Tax=Hibiscus sabdariffa TaxID=183260 RepID=A0ABR2QEL8_9ROSI
MRALGADSWRIAAALMGRHIVRDVNYVAISNALDVSPYILATGLVEDNVICAVCFITLFALASRVPLRLQHHLKVMVYVSLFASLLVVIDVVLQSERENKLPKRKVDGIADAEFKAKGSTSSWGFTSFLVRIELDDPERGYLLNDACLVEAYISTDRTDGLISRELILETDSDKHEIEEADPVTVKAAVDNLRKFYPLEKAFIILASFNCSSTTLTMEQKNELLAMVESIKEVAGRADKAKQNKKHFTDKESIKLTLTHTLDGNVIRYKEVESEVKQMEQKLAALHEQVEEAQKKMENMLGEREGIYRSCKKMKVELDAMGKEWSEYEANAKVAEEKAKIVEAEWGRMKSFISSIKHKYNKHSLE